MDWLLWVDLETSGLDVNNCHILQIAYVLTNYNLTLCLPCKEINIKTEDYQLENMDNWCKQQHTNSGLITKIKDSNISLSKAEDEIIKFLNKNVNKTDTLTIAGNSVHFDKKFIDVHMKKLSERLSYRIIDVSSFSLICKSLNNNVYKNKPVKKYEHTAQQDILESIDEYRYYINNFFCL